MKECRRCREVSDKEIGYKGAWYQTKGRDGDRGDTHGEYNRSIKREIVEKRERWSLVLSLVGGRPGGRLLCIAMVHVLNCG